MAPDPVPACRILRGGGRIRLAPSSGPLFKRGFSLCVHPFVGVAIYIAHALACLSAEIARKPAATREARHLGSTARKHTTGSQCQVLCRHKGSPPYLRTRHTRWVRPEEPVCFRAPRRRRMNRRNSHSKDTRGFTCGRHRAATISMQKRRVRMCHLPFALVRRSLKFATSIQGVICHINTRIRH